MADSNLTLDNCIESAKKYSSRRAWHAAEQEFHNAARDNGWLSICCAHMNTMPSKAEWSLAECRTDARMYSSESEWRKNSPQIHQFAKKNNWISKCLKRPIPLPALESAKKFSLDECLAEAKKHPSRKAWLAASPETYAAASLNGWTKRCIKHMLRESWSIEACIADAKKYDSRSKWQKANLSAYRAAHRHNWLEDCCSHMIARGYDFSRDMCREIAQKYATRAEWSRNSPDSFSAALNNKWLHFCMAK